MGETRKAEEKGLVVARSRWTHGQAFVHGIFEDRRVEAGVQGSRLGTTKVLTMSCRAT